MSTRALAIANQQAVVAAKTNNSPKRQYVNRRHRGIHDHADAGTKPCRRKNGGTRIASREPGIPDANPRRRSACRGYGFIIEEKPVSPPWDFVMKKDRSRESGGLFPPADADLRERAVAMAAAAWIMSGFELTLDPVDDKTMPEDNEEPPA